MLHKIVKFQLLKKMLSKNTELVFLKTLIILGVLEVSNIHI